MRNKIDAFLKFILENPIELYSEFGLQHELALFFRQNYSDLTVRLEYPTSRINFDLLPTFLKKEIDIYITDKTNKRYVIELKMPKDDCGTPNEMYNAIKDVKFLEQLKHNGIDECYSILFTERQAFWQAPQANAGIYTFFNGNSVNIGGIELHHLPNFLHKKGAIQIINNYTSEWENYTDFNNNNWKYYILNI